MSLAINPKSPERDFRKIMYEYSIKDFLLLYETLEVIDAIHIAEEKDEEQRRQLERK